MEERVLFSRLQVFRRVGDSGQKARVYKLISRKLLDGGEGFISSRKYVHFKNLAAQMWDVPPNVPPPGRR